MSAAHAHGQIADRTRLVAALDSAARAHVAHPMVAGVSVAVVRGADTLLLAGYGQVDLEWSVPTPTDASASYEIGSVTKQFTAAAILQLVEQGKLDLDADVSEVLPEFDTHGHPVPIRRLLDHTSGIKGYTEMPVFAELVVKDLPRDTLVSLVEAEPFEFEPGTAQIYNNSAYFLLGLIIEKQSGQSYEEYVAEHLFAPAGMDASYYCSESAVRARAAHGYDGSPDGLVRKGYLDHTWPYAAGSLCSTAGDLVRWNRALHGGRILSGASYQAMITPRPLRDGTPITYAMGLGVGERAGQRYIAHGGGINGFLSEAFWFPAQEMAVVVLQNSTGPQPPGALASAFLDLLVGADPAPTAVPYRGDLDALVGEYAGPARGTHAHMEVTRDGDQLVLQPATSSTPLRPTHVGDGVWRDGGSRFWFVTPGGTATELRIAQGAGHYVLRRIGR
ncbi:MAG: serine hydrolase domain-containing protein [Gemmatimonadota bacterium]|nr:beta-lactamase family protein [Gemmatimonadota bacterium]